LGVCGKTQRAKRDSSDKNRAMEKSTLLRRLRSEWRDLNAEILPRWGAACCAPAKRTQDPPLKTKGGAPGLADLKIAHYTNPK
jgi:hypothetical protein